MSSGVSTMEFPLSKLPTDVWVLVESFLEGWEKLRLLSTGDISLLTSLRYGGIESLRLTAKVLPEGAVSSLRKLRTLKVHIPQDTFSEGVNINFISTFTSWSPHLTELRLSELVGLDRPSLEALPPSLLILKCDLCITDMDSLPFSLTHLVIRHIKAPEAEVTMKYPLQFPPGLTRLSVQFYDIDINQYELKQLPPSLTSLSVGEASELAMENLLSKIPPLIYFESLHDSLRLNTSLLPSTLLKLRVLSPMSPEMLKQVPRSVTWLSIPYSYGLDTSFGHLPPNLTDLDFGNNVIRDTSILPRTIESLNGCLRSFDNLPPAITTLRKGPTTLDQLKWYPSLTFMQLSEFAQSTITDSKVSMLPRTLTSLDLTYASHLTSAGIPFLPPALKSLQIGSRDIGLVDQDIGQLPRGLTFLEITYSEDHFTDAACPLFPPLLRHLHWKGLNNFPFSKEGMLKLPKHLADHRLVQ